MKSWTDWRLISFLAMYSSRSLICSFFAVFMPLLPSFDIFSSSLSLGSRLLVFVATTPCNDCDFNRMFRWLVSEEDLWPRNFLRNYTSKGPQILLTVCDLSNVNYCILKFYCIKLLFGVFICSGAVECYFLRGVWGAYYSVRFGVKITIFIEYLQHE